MEELAINMSDDTRDLLLDALEVLSRTPEEIKPGFEIGWTSYRAKTETEKNHDYSKSEILLLGFPVTHVRERWLTRILGYPVQVRPSIRRLIEGRQLHSEMIETPKEHNSFRLTLDPPPDGSELERASMDWND